MKRSVEFSKIGGSFGGSFRPYRWIIAIDGRWMLKAHTTKEEAKAYSARFLERLVRLGF